MYNRELETDKKALQTHISNQKKASAERLKTVAAKKKLKKERNKA